MIREDLNEMLFSNTPPGPFAMKNQKQQPPYNKDQSPNPQKGAINPKGSRSNNRTQEDLEEFIEGIAFPKDDLSISSFDTSSNSNNTPQRSIGHNEPTSGHPTTQFGASDQKKPPVFHSANNKSIPSKTLQFSSGRRPQTMPHTDQQSQKPHQLKFYSNTIQEEQGMESLTPNRIQKIFDWNSQHITPGDSKTIFPQVIAPSVDLSGEHSTGKLKDNDISHNSMIDIDAVHEKSPARQRESQNNIKYEMEISKFKAEIKHLNDKLTQYDKAFQSQQREARSLDNTLKNVAQQKQELEEEIQLLRGKTGDKSDLNHLRGQNLHSAKQQLKTLQFTLHQKEMKINDLNDEIARFKSNEQSLRRSFETELQNKITEVETARILSNSHQQKAHECEMRLREYLEKNAHESLKKEEMITQYQQQISNLSNQINRLNEEIKRFKGTIDKKDIYIIHLENILNEAGLSLEKKEGEIAMLHQQQNNLHLDNHNAANLKIDRTLENKFYDMSDEMNNQREMHKKEAAKLKETIADQKEKIRFLEERLARNNGPDFGQNLGSTKKSNKGSDRPMIFDDIHDEMNHSRGASVLKEEEINMLKSRYDQELQIYRAQIADLQAKLHEHDHMNKSGYDSHNKSGLRDASRIQITQNTNCQIYLEPLHKLLNECNIYDTGSGYEECLKKLQIYITELNEMYNNVGTELHEQRKREIAMQQEISSVKTDNEQIKDFNQELKAKEREYAAKITSLNREVSDLKMQVIHLDSQIRAQNSSRSTSPIKPYAQDHDEANEQLQQYLQLNAKYETSQMELTENQTQLKKLETELSQASSELKSLKAQLVRSNNELELMRQRLEIQSGGIEKSIFDDMKKSLGDKIKALTKENETLQQELRGKELEMLGYKETITTMETERSNLVGQENIKKTLTDRLALAEKRNKELMEENSRRQHEIEEIKSKLHQLSMALEDERLRNNQSVHTNEYKIQSQSDMIKRLEDENLRGLKELNALKEKLDTKQMEYNRLLTEKNTLSLENERLGILLNQERGKDETMKILNDALQVREKSLEDLRNANNELSSELNRLRNVRSELEDKEVEGHKKIQQLASQLKEKQNELKHVIETAKKKDEAEAHHNSEMANKNREVEKLKGLQNELQKTIENLKEEKKNLTKRVSELEQSSKKIQEEMKQREEAVKAAEEKQEKNSQYLREKDKKNVDLFNLNKSLQENIKTLEQANATLKAEHEKRGKSITEKAKTINTLDQKNKELEETNQKLNNEVLDLKIKIQTLENDVSTAQLQTMKNITSNSTIDLLEKDYQEKSKEDEDMLNQTRKLLNEFQQREAEFEHIKTSCVQKIYALNEKNQEMSQQNSSLREKIQFLEKKTSTLGEENHFLSTQLSLQQNVNTSLQDKIKSLQSSVHMLQMTSYTESDVENIPPEDHIPTFANRGSKPYREIRENINEVNRNIDIDELRPPTDYDPHPLKGHYNLSMRSPGPSSKAANPFCNNILEVISPEMLSTEETVALMDEVLRRANKSTTLASLLHQSEEFRCFTRSVKPSPKAEDVEYGFISDQQMMTSVRTGRQRIPSDHDWRSGTKLTPFEQ